MTMAEDEVIFLELLEAGFLQLVLVEKMREYTRENAISKVENEELKNTIMFQKTKIDTLEDAHKQHAVQKQRMEDTITCHRAEILSLQEQIRKDTKAALEEKMTMEDNHQKEKSEWEKLEAERGQRIRELEDELSTKESEIAALQQQIIVQQQHDTEATDDSFYSKNREVISKYLCYVFAVAILALAILLGADIYITKPKHWRLATFVLFYIQIFAWISVFGAIRFYPGMLPIVRNLTRSRKLLIAVVSMILLYLSTAGLTFTSINYTKFGPWVALVTFIASASASCALRNQPFGITDLTLGVVVSNAFTIILQKRILEGVAILMISFIYALCYRVLVIFEEEKLKNTQNEGDP